MAKKSRECITCGEKYSYCPSCNRKEPAWMSEFHEENCKNIFQICTSFNVNVMSKHEAKAALEQCDLSNKVNFKAYIQHDLENILKEEPVKRGKKAEIVIDEAEHEVVEK